MKVFEALRKLPVTVEADRTLVEVARLMDSGAVGAVVVVDSGMPVGIVTDRDMVVRGLGRGTPMDGRIDEIMTTEVMTIDCEADLRDALGIFERHAIRRLPVLKDGLVIGMITVDDLMIDLIADMSTLVRPVTGQVIFGHGEAGLPATT